MRRHVLWALLTMFGLAGCGSGATDETATTEPTPSELDDIDEAAERAAEQITEESADVEFEKLKAEMSKK